MESTRVNLKLKPDTHREAKIKAGADGVTLQRWVERLVELELSGLTGAQPQPEVKSPYTRRTAKAAPDVEVQKNVSDLGRCWQCKHTPGICPWNCHCKNCGGYTGK